MFRDHSVSERERHFGFGADAIALMIRVALPVAFAVLFAPIFEARRGLARFHAPERNANGDCGVSS